MAKGPVPKRSDLRIRRNKPVIEIDKVEVLGDVKIPDLDIDDPHPMVVDIYESLTHSGQAYYYEPSDWQYARFAMHFANQLLKTGRPGSQLLAVVQQMFTDLLISEGSRRRMRMEVERNKSSDDGKVIDISDVYRQKLGSG